MHPHISQALTNLQNANYVGYFDEMDKVELPNNLQPIYATYKSQFMQGLKTVEFFQQLEVFAKEVDQQTTIALPDNKISVVKVYDSPPKTWQSWLQKRRGRQDKTYWQCLAYTPLGYNQDDITKTLTAYLPPLTKEAQSKDEETLRKTYGLYEAEPDIENEFFNKNKRVLLLTGEVGTGKTTLMQKLFLQKAKQRVGKKIAFIYADQDTHAHIALAIAQGVQWLWIDAFDEDAQARQAQNEAEFLYRLKSLMEQVQGVERVLLSMRTEFLPEDDIQTDIFDAYSTCFVNLGLFAKPQILEHLTTHAYMRKENFVKALREQLHKNNIFLRPFLFSRAEEVLMEREGAYKQTPYAYTYQAYQKVVENWAGREQDKKKQEKAPNWVGFAGKVIAFCERVALYFYEGRQAIHYKEIEQQRETLGLDLHDARNHALLVRDERGNYRFAHNVFLDYFIARNLLKGNIREEDLDKQKHKVSYELYEEMLTSQAVKAFKNGLDEHRLYIYNKQQLRENQLYIKDFPLTDILPYLLKDANFQEMFANNYFTLIIFENCGIQSQTLATLIDTVYNNELLLSFLIQKSQIQNIEPLSKLVNLRELSLRNNQITHIDALQSLVNLQELWLKNNQITNIDTLQPLVYLQKLELNNNQITNIDALQSLVHLQELYLDNNQITNIDALQSLAYVQLLTLDNNQITNIDVLQSLAYVQVLTLDNNQITNIDALQLLVHLQILYLYNNQITNIDALQSLVHLQNLWLDKNNIQDISPLLGLKQLKTLFLYGNPITAEAMTRLREALPNTDILFTHTEVKVRYAQMYASISDEDRTYFAKLWDIPDEL